jgi:NACHT domain
MAGTGKTTVTETFCSHLNKKGILGASFFCSVKSRRVITTIFPSIAKTLAGHHPRFRESLVEVLATCSDPVGMNLEDQFRILILGPAEMVFNEDEIIVVVIDALDECEDQEGTEIMRLLKTILDSKPNVPLRFFVTSRPERHIRDAFKRQHYSSLRLHDIEDHIVQADIVLYLNDRLGRVEALKRHYGSSWPPPQIKIIAQRAGKLFVYASTISKYITNRGHPVERLLEVSTPQGLESSGEVAVESIQKLYSLYSLILEDAFTEISKRETSRIRSCLSILVSTQQPLIFT